MGNASYILFLQRTAMLVLLGWLVGCGKTTTQTATEQLLTSNAVDRVVSQIDFTPLRGQKVFFDDQYMKTLKTTTFVNSDYVISSLRQQIMAAGCHMQDRKEEADYIIEARIGAMGNDMHEINYGIPANNLLNSATSLVPTAPAVPAIPEISLAKKQHHVGAAKIGVFAYHRETKEAVWQAGVNAERSRSKESWFLGVGPYQSGTIYKEPLFAGNQINRPIKKLLLGTGKTKSPVTPPPVNYNSPYMFPLAYQLKAEQLKKAVDEQQGVEWANHEQTQKELSQLLEQLKAEQKDAPAKLKESTNGDAPASVK